MLTPTHRTRPHITNVTAERFSNAQAEYAIKYANALPSEREGMEPPSLPRGVRYLEQGGFLLDVPGTGDDVRVTIGCWIVRDHADVPSVMDETAFEERYEPMPQPALRTLEPAAVAVPVPATAHANTLPPPPVAGFETAPPKAAIAPPFRSSTGKFGKGEP